MSIGINLRVTGHTSIGGRKYQEDFFSVAYQHTENDQSLEYAFFGIYDGHGGAEASIYAKEHLMNTIVSQKMFWSENDDEVLKAIREGYIQTHYSMWREQDKWPKTSSGLPSTAGTTASIAFIRRGKIYIGHVGDSGIVLGYQKDKESSDVEMCRWGATPLTEDHKPEAYAEKMRIMSCGGKVVTKSGVPRVVWNRPRIGHKGPVRRSTPIDEIPFLAVARSLGDLWSYNSAVNEFVVSPNPDVSVIEIDPKKYRCLIFGTDGLWNVLSPKSAVEIVHAAEMENIRIALEGGRDWKNPSKLLVNEALERWSKSNMKADNTSVVIIMLDPPGPPKRDVLRSMKTSVQHIGYETTCTQPLDNMKITLYDHTTRETIDLSQVSCQEAPPIGHDNVQHPQYLDSTASASYQDMAYSDSFAESYNTFLNTTLSNDHSYTNYTTTTQQYTLQHHQQQQHHPQQQQQQQPQHHAVHGVPYLDETHEGSQQDLEETYSLTNLQTKSERMHSEMLEGSTSSPSSSRCPHLACTGNVAIIENFHDYPLPHMPQIHNHPPFDSLYPHHSFQQQQLHQHHEQPTYQMERYDYHHPLPEDQVGCSYSNQPYTAHDLSEHNYQRDIVEYLYPEEESEDCPQDDDEAERTEEPPTAKRSFEESTDESNVAESESITCDVTEIQPNSSNEPRSNDELDEEGIQINEISSSNFNALSPAQEAVNQSDSDSCASGDEAKASSSTSRAVISPAKLNTKKNATRIEKEKGRMKKTLKNIVKIVYETRSSQRPHRTRGQQENLNTSTGKTMRSKFSKFLAKNTNVKSFLGFKKTRKPGSCNLSDNNNSTANNNNICAKDGSDGSDLKTPVERRVLRSADQVKAETEKPVQRTRRAAESVALINSTNQPGAQKKAAAPLATADATRKLPKRKMLLRKVAIVSDAKRVRR